MTTKSLTLSLDEQQSIPLSTVSGTQGYPGMDIRPLASAGICSCGLRSDTLSTEYKF